MFKQLIKFVLPEIFIKKINIILKRNIKIKGSFRDWRKAIKSSGTYENKEIFKKVKSSFLKVINNKAKFERDSVLFTSEKLNKPLIDLLDKIRIKKKNKKLIILDYGGSFGSTYFQNIKILSNELQYQWDIIEQKKIVNFANKTIKIKNLTFQNSINEYFKKSKPDIVIFSSVLHYLEFPFKLIEKIIKKKINYFLILNTPFFDDKSDIKIQLNPKHIYKASYPIRIFNLRLFKSYFFKNRFKIVKLNWDNQVIDGINFKSFFIKNK